MVRYSETTPPHMQFTVGIFNMQSRKKTQVSPSPSHQLSSFIHHWLPLTQKAFLAGRNQVTGSKAVVYSSPLDISLERSPGELPLPLLPHPCQHSFKSINPVF